MCMGGGGSPAYPPTPPNPDQVAYDKLQVDKDIQRRSYIAAGYDPDKPLVTQLDQTPGKVALGAPGGTSTVVTK